MEHGMVKEGFGVELLSRVQLRAIFSGLVVAIGFVSVCTGVSWAIGLSTFHPTPSRAYGLAVGIYIWSAVAMSLSVLIGAYVAAVVARAADVRDGVLHGLVVWGAVATFLFLVFLRLFSGVMSDLLEATGANLASRTGVEETQPLIGASRDVVVQMAHDAGGILWVYWVGVITGLVAAIVGGWLGARAEQRAPLRRTRAHKLGMASGLPAPQPT